MFSKNKQKPFNRQLIIQMSLICLNSNWMTINFSHITWNSGLFVTFVAKLHSILWFLCNRPHLKAFLQQMSKLFELHMYTMGTQAYARRIGEIIDPDHSLFHHRILARDACGAALSKDLKRLFPGGGKLAVVNLYFHFMYLKKL